MATERYGGKGEKEKKMAGMSRVSWVKKHSIGKSKLGHYTNGFCWKTARSASNAATRLLVASFQECR